MDFEKLDKNMAEYLLNCMSRKGWDIKGACVYWGIDFLEFCKMIDSPNDELIKKVHDLKSLI